MNKAQFIAALETRGFTASPFDTTNEWGFGGGIGTSYAARGAEVRIGTAYHRHLPSEPFASARIGAAAGRGILLNRKGFTAALAAIDKHLASIPTP